MVCGTEVYWNSNRSTHDRVGKSQDKGEVVLALFEIMKKKKKKVPETKDRISSMIHCVSTPLLLKLIRISLPILTCAELGQWRTSLEVRTVKHILPVSVLKPAAI